MALVTPARRVIMKRVIVCLAVLLVTSLTPALDSVGYARPVLGKTAIISGSVTFAGAVPTLPAIKLDYATVPCGATTVPDESLVVGPNRGIRYAVLSLEGSTKVGAIRPRTVHYLNCERCRFVPHVVAMSVGDSLVINDYDPIFHVLEAMVPGGKMLASWTVDPRGMTVGDSRDTTVGDPGGMTVGEHRPTLVAHRPEIVGVVCSLHSWMAAYVVVTDTPYYAVTDANGHYVIDGVPPGQYVLKVWTELLGQQQRKITLPAGSSAKADFTFPQSINQ